MMETKALCEDIADLVDEKIEIERIEQEEFIDKLKTQMYEEQLEELNGITQLAKLLSQKVNEKYNYGFAAISKIN